jgi:hypothetical protein
MEKKAEIEEITILLTSTQAEEKIMGILWCQRIGVTDIKIWEDLLTIVSKAYQDLVPLIYSHPMAFNAYQKAFIQLLDQLMLLFEKEGKKDNLRAVWDLSLGKRALVNFEPNLILWEKLEASLS